MNSTIAKDFAMLVRVTHKIIKKMLRMRVAAIISTFFDQQEFSEGQPRPIRIELAPHSARNDKVPTSLSQGNIPSAIRAGFDAGSCVVTKGINQEL